jgi:hypothetical protein
MRLSPRRSANAPRHVVISQEPALLKFRSIGLSDFAVLEGSNRIGRIRLATERMPRVWLWSVTLPLPGDLPTGSSKDLDTARGQVQGGMEKLEGPDHARATDSSLRGDEVRDDE